MYRKQFIEAIKYTRKLGFNHPVVKLQHNKRHIDKYFLNEGLNNLILEKFGRINLKSLSRGCVNVHYAFLPIIKEYFSCNAYLTIGNVSEHNEYTYNINENTLNNLLNYGITGPFPFHCWITLDSLEIIDLTYATSQAYQLNNPKNIGQMLAIHPEDIKEINDSFFYEPILAGKDFLMSMGINPETGVALCYMPPRKDFRIIKKIKSILLNLLDRT